MPTDLILLASLFVALAIVIKLTGRLQRSWVERNLHVGDLRALSNIAFGRAFEDPNLGQLERLSGRGFLSSDQAACCMTLIGWVAVILRKTSARSKPPSKGHRRLAGMK